MVKVGSRSLSAVVRMVFSS